MGIKKLEDPVTAATPAAIESHCSQWLYFMVVHVHAAADSAAATQSQGGSSCRVNEAAAPANDIACVLLTAVTIDSCQAIQAHQQVTMQLNRDFVFVATALLALASPAMSATIQFFAGADCTGSSIGTITAGSGECVFLTNGGSARSIRFSGVPNQISFFISGGAHDICTNGANLTLTGSGCSTAPAGVNWESVFLN
ncbi:hypothetical protein K435DRAFT_870323 [Dendrothele bispora CBS 962.96]|uniref:Uncharacterized protein n=1 Tax=Dendrothele bispora (strain CBS 962.96) TaxID=1314807 RepID=A0A4V4HCS3_DENBC|nr:hypothetical protein K435DRAFT_870323 [Dendrothele bispora CBS 962.96]